MADRDKPLRHAWQEVVAQAAEKKFLLAGMVVTIFVIFAVLSYGVIEQGDQFRRSAARQNKILQQNEGGIACLLAEQDAHRIANQEAHETLATSVASPTILPEYPPIELNADQVNALRQGCGMFFQRLIPSVKGK